MSKISKPKQLLISTLILGTAAAGTILPTTTTYADYLSSDGTSWWSVQELLNYEDEFEAELTRQCGDDASCKSNIRFTERWGDEFTEYAALMHFKGFRFLITDINPWNETIKAIYFDVDTNMGFSDEPDPLQSLYVAWFDEWTGQIYNYDYKTFTNGSHPEIHTMYDNSLATSGEGWFIPNEEFTISIAGTNLLANTTGKLGYVVKSRWFNASGATAYSNCVESPNYQEGAECKMYISEYGELKFFTPADLQEKVTAPDPVKPEPVAEPETDPSAGSDPSNSEPVTESDAASSPKGSENSSTSFGGVGDIASVAVQKPNAQYVAIVSSNEQDKTATMESGKNNSATKSNLAATTKVAAKGATSEEEHSKAGGDDIELPAVGAGKKSAEFPWWVFLLVLGGTAAIIVIFLVPIGKKKSDN